MIARARFAALLCMLPLLACVRIAHAGVVLSNTRIVFPGDAQEVTLRLNNQHAHPVLVETWVESATRASAGVPFAADPPLFRIDPGKGQVVRVHRLPGALPEDRETLFWFNVLDVPPNAPASALSEVKIALRTRVKLFHRPRGLAGSAAKAPAALRWRALGRTQIEVDNPTPYHVTIARIADGATWTTQGAMVAPFSRMVLQHEPAAPAGTIVFEAVNDLGGRDRFETEVVADGAR